MYAFVRVYVSRRHLLIIKKQSGCHIGNIIVIHIIIIHNKCNLHFWNTYKLVINATITTKLDRVKIVIKVS